jgi:hypothetical protein
VSALLCDITTPILFVVKGEELVLTSYYLDNDSQRGILHRDDGPARVWDYPWGQRLDWFDHGVRRRKGDKPVSVVIENNGTVLHESCKEFDLQFYTNLQAQREQFEACEILKHKHFRH